MQIAITLLGAALILELIAILRLSKSVDDVLGMAATLATEINSAKTGIGDTQSYVSELDAELKQKISDLDEQYAEARGMIAAAKAAAEEEAKAAKEAQKTERRLQEGINSILNYSSQKYDGEQVM